LIRKLISNRVDTKTYVQEERCNILKKINKCKLQNLSKKYNKG